MKSIYLRNFTVTTVLVLTCFLLVSFSFVSIGRIYLIREYKSTMDNSAQEVARAAEAISQEMLSGGKDTLQVWTPSSGTLALFNQTWATIVYPETGEEIPITEAVERRQPEYLVLTIGVNGVSMMDEEQFKADYIDLVQRIQKVSPDTKIICNSIYPVQASYEAKDNGINNTVIERANGWIKQIAEETGTRYLDSASVLKGEDGCLNPDYGNGDGIHLGPAGFEIVLNYIRTHAYK